MVTLGYLVVALLNYSSVSYADDLVTVAVNKMRLVSYDKHESLARDRLKQIHNHYRVLLVKVTRRLVCKNKRGIFDYSTGNCNSLLLTARECRGDAVAVFCHINALERRHNSLLDLALVTDSAESERECNVFINAHSAREIVVLENISDVEVSRLVGVGRHTLVVKGNATRACLVESAYHIEKRGLSASGFTEERDHSPLGKCHIYVVDRVDLVGSALIIKLIE